MCEALPNKKCFKCGEVKALSDFYKHPMMADGHVNKCKECNKRDVRKNREDNIDYVREYDRTRRKKENVSEERWQEILSRGRKENFTDEEWESRSAKRKEWSENYYAENPDKWEERLSKSRKAYYRPDEWEELAEAQRQASREYYAENPDKWEERLAKGRKENCDEDKWKSICAAKRRYAEANPDKLSDLRKRYREANPKKYKAHSAVGRAIKSGKMTPGVCEVCGSNKVHGHHCDYDKPLEVMWLCPEHHHDWHRKHGEGLNAS